jgi:uncharacterized protein with beta-barrel porin domain
LAVVPDGRASTTASVVVGSGSIEVVVVGASVVGAGAVVVVEGAVVLGGSWSSASTRYATVATDGCVGWDELPAATSGTARVANRPITRARVRMVDLHLKVS